MSQQYQPPQPMQVPPPQYVPPVTQVVVSQAANMSPTVSIGDWFILMLVECIPVVNFIMMIVWALDSSKPSRANFVKMQWIMMILSIVLGIVVAILIGGGAIALSGLDHMRN